LSDEDVEWVISPPNQESFVSASSELGLPIAHENTINAYPIHDFDPLGVWIWTFEGSEGHSALYAFIWNGECQVMQA